MRYGKPLCSPPTGVEFSQAGNHRLSGWPRGARGACGSQRAGNLHARLSLPSASVSGLLGSHKAPGWAGSWRGLRTPGVLGQPDAVRPHGHRQGSPRSDRPESKSQLCHFLPWDSGPMTYFWGIGFCWALSKYEWPAVRLGSAGEPSLVSAPWPSSRSAGKRGDCLASEHQPARLGCRVT